MIKRLYIKRWKSDINLQQIKYKTEDSFFDYFTKVNKIILFKNHKLNLNYNKDKLSIKGVGKIQLEEKFENILNSTGL